MKNSIVLSFFLFLSLGLSAQVDLIESLDGNKSELEEGFEFSPIIDLEATPVKSQGASGTCWSYCSNSFLESEMIRMGKEPIDLAEMYTVRNVYEEKADRYVRMHGYLNYGQGGALPDVIDMYRKYGMVPYEVYTGLQYGTDINRHGEMESMLKGMLDAVIENPNKQLSTAWKAAISSVLDVYLGAFPSKFEYKGNSYTPQTFAETFVGINPDDYVQITSWSHQPYYQPMVIMVPDNWNYGLSYNVQMEDMITIIDNALKKGYTVSWAADVSEKYFSWRNGIAYVPVKEVKDMSEDEVATMFSGPREEMTITAEMRQAGYDNFTTTDDHGMQIVGLIKDQNGKEWYKIKNSWGTGNNYEGYLYVSKNYVRYKTISFLLHQEAIPAGIRNRLKM
ncbi:MAG: aminopeptidase [Saprospiraceae bacterium]|nr:aminopeptidase [Saprospiraceae bacterium]